MWSTRRELSQQCDVTASLSCREGPGPVWVLWYYTAVLVGSSFCRLAQFRIHVAAASLRAFIFCPPRADDLPDRESTIRRLWSIPLARTVQSSGVARGARRQ